MTTDRNEHQARKLLALGLDEFGHHTEAANVRAGIDLDDYRVDLWAIRAALDSQTAAAPGIDLREIGGVMAEAEKHVETLHSLCPRASVFECIKRLRKAQAALIDASPKGYGAQQAAAQAMVIALTDGYRWNGQRWQRYSPDGALIEHFGAAEGLGSTTAAARSIRVPAGWALVPDRMQLTPENMELLADTLRGADEDEPWCGGVLWIGQTTDDDGEPTYYGLNVGNVECLEEGSINIVEFDPPADSPKGGSTVVAELVEAISAFKGKRGAFMALGAQDARTVRLWSALARAQASDAEVRP